MVKFSKIRIFGKVKYDITEDIDIVNKLRNKIKNFITKVEIDSKQLTKAFITENKATCETTENWQKNSSGTLLITPK